MLLKLKPLSNILKKKISPNKIVYLECNLFGTLNELKKQNPKIILKEFTNMFLKLIGDKGTLITPSFSYSWGQTKNLKIFDKNNTYSTTGIFSEYLRKLKKFDRSEDPMFSCLIYGYKSNYFLDISNTSFGNKSVFHKLYLKNSYLVNYGIRKFDPTFVHFVEEYFNNNIKKINYRKLFKFKGIINKKRGIHYSFMRVRGSKYIYYDKNIKKELIKKKLLIHKRILNQDLYICKAKDFFVVGFEILKKNNKFFINLYKNV